MLFLGSQHTWRSQYSFHCLPLLDGETDLQRESDSLWVMQQVCTRAEAQSTVPLVQASFSHQTTTKGQRQLYLDAFHLLFIHGPQLE